MHCPEQDCGWRAIAATDDAARTQLDEHLREAHTERVDADVPAGTVQVRAGEHDEWLTVTVEQAAAYHDALHDADD